MKKSFIAGKNLKWGAKNNSIRGNFPQNTGSARKVPLTIAEARGLPLHVADAPPDLFVKPPQEIRFVYGQTRGGGPLVPGYATASWPTYAMGGSVYRSASHDVIVVVRYVVVVSMNSSAGFNALGEISS